MTFKVKKKQSLSLPLVPGALSQPRPLPSAGEFAQAVERQIQSARNPREALAIISALDGMGRLASHGLAVALYALEKRWETAWGDFAESVFVVPGYDVETCKRYAKVGRFLANVPRKPLKESFLERPISDLVAIAQAREEHGDFSLTQLQALAGSSDNADLRKKLKQVTQRKERANGALEIVLDSEGTLTAWQGGQGMAFGYLTPDLAANSLGQRARARLLKRARIQER